MTFRNHRLRDFAVPMSTNWLLTDLKAAGQASCSGKGPAVRWQYLGSKGINP